MELTNKFKFNKDEYVIEEKQGRVVFISNRYKKWFRVGNTAKDILLLMDGRNTLDDIIQKISSEYDIPYLQVKGDVISFCREALKNGYIIEENQEEIVEKLDDFLRNIYINVTNKCNFECKYCNSIGELHTDIDFEQLKKYIDKLIEDGRIRNSTINITGGEPLLCKQIKEILYYFKSKSLPIVLWTNGKYINSENIYWIKETCTYVVLPLDSEDKEKNDQVRDVGAYDSTLQGIKICNEHGIEFLCACTPTEDTYCDLESLTLFVEKLGANSLIINEPIRENYKGQRIDKFGYSEEAFDQVYNETADKATLIKSWQNYKSTKRAFTIQKSREVCLNNIYYVMNKSGCGMYKNELLIDSDGKIYPCHMLYNPVFYCGDIYGSNVEQLPEIVSKENEFDSCKKCEVKFLCLGGCKARRYYLNKGQMKPSEKECNIYRKKTTDYMFGLFED